MDTINLDNFKFDIFLPEHLDFFILDCPRYYLAWNVEKPTHLKNKGFYFEFSTEKKTGRVWFFVRGFPYKYYVYFTNNKNEILERFERIERIDLINLLNENITK